MEFGSRHAEGKAYLQIPHRYSGLDAEKLEPWSEVDTLQVLVDSGWATDKMDRISTSAGVAQIVGCTILCLSRAPLPAEAEEHAVGSGACGGLFICTVASVFWRRSEAGLSFRQ